MQVGRFGHERELGRPVATYGFFSWPFPVSHRAQITADFGLGVSWNWTAFDRYTNPTNTALGSPVAYYVDGGVSLRVIATGRASVYVGLDATHWSNGSTSQPNLGLAVIGPKLGVRYNFAPQPTRSRAMPADLPRFEPSWEFVVGVAGSAYQYDMSFLRHDEIDETDVVVELPELTIVVPRLDAPALDQATIDVDGALGGGLVIDNPKSPMPTSPALSMGPVPELTGHVADRVRQVLDLQVNPAIAAHGGSAELVTFRYIAIVERAGDYEDRHVATRRGLLHRRQHGKAAVVGQAEVNQEKIRPVVFSELLHKVDRLIGIFRMDDVDTLAENLPSYRQRDERVIGIVFDQQDPDPPSLLSLFCLVHTLIHRAPSEHARAVRP